MYGYEYELQTQRNQAIQADAENHRIVSLSVKPNADLRRVIGRQLVKLGMRLQGRAPSAQTFAAA